MTEQWQELKDTIIELRDGDGTGTQQKVCKFLANYMDILEKQMQESVVSKQVVIDIVDSYSESQSNVEDVTQDIISDIVALPSVNPQPCEELDFVQPHKKFPVNLEACKMREATQEEREGIEQYIDSISIAEPCEDTIDRQAVLDMVEDMTDQFGNKHRVVTEGMISLLPPVTPLPKAGHWIEHPEIETSTPEYLMFYECSECGDKQCFCKSDIHKKRFCGNCGCRMVEPHESEG